MLQAKTNLATSLGDAGLFELAIPMFEEVIETWTKSEASASTLSFLSAITNFTATLGKQGKPKQAVELLKPLLELVESGLPPHDPGRLMVMGNIAAAFGDVGFAVVLSEREGNVVPHVVCP